MDPAAAIAWASPLLRWSGVPHLPAMPCAALRGIAPMSAGWVSRFRRGRAYLRSQRAAAGPHGSPSAGELGPTWPAALALGVGPPPWSVGPRSVVRRGMVALPDQCPVTHLSGQLE